MPIISFTLVLATGVRLIMISLASDRGLRRDPECNYSKRYDLLHTTRFHPWSTPNRTETMVPTRLQNPWGFAYNMMQP
jgi:hypothetical protein